MSIINQSYLDADDTAAAMERAEAISLLPLDQDPVGKPRPQTIAESWTDLEYDKLADEQHDLQQAAGEALSRPHAVTAKRVSVQAEVDETLLAGQKQAVEETRDRWLTALRDLGGFVRRERHAKWIYWIGWFLIGAGDVAGVSGAAIFLGELPVLAVAQGISIAVAAVLSGLIGSDVKDARMARRRRTDGKTLPADIAWRFAGGDSGEKIVKGMLLVSLIVVITVTVAIFTLRSATQDMYAASAFAGMAAAVCLASFTNRYAYTDEIADYIAGAKAEHFGASKALCKLAKSEAIAVRDSETEEAESIRREYNLRAAAGEKRVRSFKFGISRNNPAVFGHGLAAGVPRTDLDDLAELERQLRDDEADTL